MTPSIVDLPHMRPEQKHTFESMALSNKFDNERTEEQVTYWTIWYLTPRVFEKEAENKAIQRAQAEASAKATRTVEERAKKTSENNSKSGVVILESSVTQVEHRNSEALRIELPKEIVVSHWDPHLYRSKIWRLVCLSGASFGALHLVSWNTIFPTIIELWMWRISAFVSIVSMVVFMHFEKVVFRWGGPLTFISLVSPALYFASRIVMMDQVFAALRAEDPAIYDTYEVSAYWLHLL